MEGCSNSSALAMENFTAVFHLTIDMQQWSTSSLTLHDVLFQAKADLSSIRLNDRTIFNEKTLKSNIWSAVKFHENNGLVQHCNNSTANAMELLQSCTKPLE